MLSAYRLTLSKKDNLRTRNNCDLVNILEKLCPSANETPDVDCIILDGAAIVYILRPSDISTFLEYASQILISYVQLKLNQSLHVDPVCEEYMPNSLKASAQEKRDTNIRRRVLPDNKLPKKWHSFPRLDENKQE